MSGRPAAAFVPVDGRRVHVERWDPPAGAAGATGAVAPVVLVHGLGGSTINWHLVAPRLATALGAPVHAVDLVGFGRTPLDGRRSTIGENARLVRAFLRGLRDDAEPGAPAPVLVGNSMGGAVVVRAAAREPDLVGTLVLVNPALPFGRGVPSPRDVRNLAVFAAASLPVAGPWLMDTRARRIGAAGVVDGSLRASGVDPETMDPLVRDALVELTAWRHETGVASRAYHDAIRSLLPYLARVMPSDLAAVQAPTLLVHGRDDGLVPIGLAHALARQRPEWDVAVLDCGHLPLLEAPAALADTVTRWLGAVAAAAG
jgi:pimeloyl-ACP methyl ester carboxylesterase